MPPIGLDYCGEPPLMARLFFSTQQCVGADTTRRRYNADRKGFIHVENSQDLKDLKAGGYVEAESIWFRGAKNTGSVICATVIVSLTTVPSVIARISAGSYHLGDHSRLCH